MTPVLVTIFLLLVCQCIGSSTENLRPIVGKQMYRSCTGHPTVRLRLLMCVCGVPVSMHCGRCAEISLYRVYRCCIDLPSHKPRRPNLRHVAILGFVCVLKLDFTHWIATWSDRCEQNFPPHTHTHPHIRRCSYLNGRKPFFFCAHAHAHKEMQPNCAPPFHSSLVHFVCWRVARPDYRCLRMN